MLFSSTTSCETEIESSALSELQIRAEPAAPNSVVARLEQELADLEATKIHVIDSEEDLLGKWLFF